MPKRDFARIPISEAAFYFLAIYTLLLLLPLFLLFFVYHLTAGVSRRCSVCAFAYFACALVSLYVNRYVALRIDVIG